MFRASTAPVNKEETNQEQLLEWFGRLAAGEASAFKNIYNYYYPRVFQLAFAYAKKRELAEDTAQLIFMKVWERREELSEIDNPEGWLFRAAKFQVWKLLEKEMMREQYQKDILAGIENNALTTLYKIEDEELQSIIDIAVNTLSPKQKQVYKLGREQGLTYRQISEQLAIGQETVKEHMTASLKKLKQFLLKHKDWLLTIIVTFLV